MSTHVTLGGNGHHSGRVMCETCDTTYLERRAISDNQQQVLGTCDSDIHTSNIGEEPDSSVRIDPPRFANVQTTSPTLSLLHGARTAVAAGSKVASYQHALAHTRISLHRTPFLARHPRCISRERLQTVHIVAAHDVSVLPASVHYYCVSR
jgi:hypothetical protein